VDVSPPRVILRMARYALHTMRCMVRNRSDTKPKPVDLVEGTDPAALKGPSDSYFGAPWILPVATALAQTGKAMVETRDVMKLGIDRSTALRNIDKLIGWGAVTELDSTQDRAENERRLFTLVDEHFIWGLIPKISEWSARGRRTSA
jgi:hypothetical protein